LFDQINFNNVESYIINRALSISLGTIPEKYYKKLINLMLHKADGSLCANLEQKCCFNKSKYKKGSIFEFNFKESDVCVYAEKQLGIVKLVDDEKIVLHLISECKDVIITNVHSIVHHCDLNRISVEVKPCQCEFCIKYYKSIDKFYGYNKNQVCDVKDKYGLWYHGYITEKKPFSLHIHFLGFKPTNDEFIYEPSNLAEFGSHCDFVIHNPLLSKKECKCKFCINMGGSSCDCEICEICFNSMSARLNNPFRDIKKDQKYNVIIGFNNTNAKAIAKNIDKDGVNFHVIGAGIDIIINDVKKIIPYNSAVDCYQYCKCNDCLAYYTEENSKNSNVLDKDYCFVPESTKN
jgi:hypothetical protein